ncbi:MAG: phage shock protein operon transcriptional activator [Oceanococcus sp.]|nr:MAG: phage shock protein operon transcriptional activator [Oceanococcus sp.]
MPTSPLPVLLGESEAFLEAVEAASRLAELERSALVIGERGTGKELFAARIHYLSPRWDKPFLKLNCAALSEDLLDAELFGHVPGAFTGAQRARPGRFEAADGGSLFLDELATMSSRLQEKVLRVIEYGEFEPLGSSETRKISVRVIGATNEDLPRAVEQGRFRGDLLDRLSFDVVTLPPLRARRDDILLLAEQFAQHMTSELERDVFAGFAPGAQAALLDYAWPGNVRELRNVVERSVYRHEAADRPLRHLIFDPFASPYRPQTQPHTSTQTQEAVALPRYPFDLKAFMEEQEVDVLKKALADHHHHQGQTAQALGLSYDQLRTLVRKYRLNKS